MADKSFTLLRTDSGLELPFNHAARDDDATWTCAQCHSDRRVAGPTSDGLEMAVVPGMEFRHVGFGAKAPFGVPRQNSRALLSPYLNDLIMGRGRANAGAVDPVGGRYGSLGAPEALENACDPVAGCRGCTDPGYFKLCLMDASDLSTLQWRTLGLDFNHLPAEVASQVTACEANIALGMQPVQCDFLKCVRRRIADKAPLVSPEMKDADPTYGCPMETPRGLKVRCPGKPKLVAPGREDQCG